VHQFSGKGAVVTGAASGMGFAFAERFAREGMRVVLADIDAPALDRAVAELRAGGGDVRGIVTDVSRAEAVEALARGAVDAFGKVHLVCNNAGVDGYLEGPIWEAAPADWQWTFAVNFWSVVYGIRSFLPLLLEHGEGGHVVNTASTTGLVHASNMYGITKHAVVALSEVLYAQLRQAELPVGVSVLCPGIVNTRLFDASHTRPLEQTAAGEAMRAQMRQRLAQAIPPAQVADVLMDAIRTQQFYVLTDHNWDDRIRARSEAVLDRATPNVSVRAG
jgi:NAD(P)-dependent dehydrogenase (short-subunit alcohol dehydrogenase family)